MVFGKAPKTTVTLPKRGSGSTQWDPAKAPKTTKVTKYVGAMDPPDEEGDDKEPSSEEEPSSKGKGGFGSASSRTKTTTTKKVVLPTAAKSASSPEVKTSADRELQELVKKLVELSITSNKNAETLRSAFKGAVDSMKGVAGGVSTALESITAQSKESHDATMDGMKVVVNELLSKIGEGAKVNDENEVRSFVRGWDRANTCSGGVVVIAPEGATVEGGLEGCKRFESLAEILGLEGVEASDEEEGGGTCREELPRIYHGRGRIDASQVPRAKEMVYPMSPFSGPVSSTLLPEILGFHPQLLLDDIINAANEPIYQCTEFVSAFMVGWATERNERNKEDVSKEIEQGLVAFQTLLESHVDLAFDYFEVWTLRNIFTIPPDIPIVVPHQSGLNLHHDPQGEAELFNEIEDLRKKLQNRRRLNHLLKSALPVSRAQLARSRARFESVSFLPSRPVSPTTTQTLSKLVGELPDPIPPDLSSLMPSTSQLHDPSKRPWEQSKVGYNHWAVARLVERTKGDEPGDRDPLVADAQREVFGDSGEIWGLHGAMEADKTTRPH